MKTRMFSMSSVVVIATIALTGCSTLNTTANSVESQAYWDGYNGNVGVSPAMLNNAGSAQIYCEANLGLHPDYTSAEQSDYIRGCLDVVGGDATGTSDNTESSTSEDLLSRLKSAGGDSWSEDMINLLDGPAGFRTDYLARGACTLWVFDDGDYADQAVQDGFLDQFTSYTYSWGTESSGLGVIAMYEDESSACAADMLAITGWGTWPE
jgi:hypothetical protein